MKASHIIAVQNICKRGDVVFLRKLLSSNCNFEEVKDRKGRNALHYCAETDEVTSDHTKPGGRLACAALLLESEFDLQNQADNDGFLPLHYAVIHGNIPLVKLLLAHDVDVNSLVNPPSTNEAIHEEGNTAVSGRSALHLAVIYANSEMVDFLLSGSFEDDKGIAHQFKLEVNIQDAQSATALHYAVQLPEGISASMIKCIVENSDCDIDSGDVHGRTPLIWAATIGASLPANVLLRLGADPCKAEKSGLTALHCAASRGHASTVQSIIQYLEDSKMTQEERRMVLDAQDTDGCTPLFYSVTMGHPNVTKKLLAAGADAKATDSRGRGLFHCASRATSNSVSGDIALLLEYGADPAKLNVVGDTPLHEACTNTNKECVKRLLQINVVAESLVNLRNSTDQTPLQIATHQALKTKEQTPNQNKAVEICRMLVEAKANVGTDDGVGTSPLSMVRNCLRRTPNYRAALELERIFNGIGHLKSNISNSMISNQEDITDDPRDTSDISSISFDRSTGGNDDICRTASEHNSTTPVENECARSKGKNGSCCTCAKSESGSSLDEIQRFVDEQINEAADLKDAADERTVTNAAKTESSRSTNASKKLSSMGVCCCSNLSDLSGLTSSTNEVNTSRSSSTVSYKSKADSSTHCSSNNRNTPKEISRSSTQTSSMAISPKSRHPNGNRKLLKQTPSRRRTSSRRSETSSITSSKVFRDNQSDDPLRPSDDQSKITSKRTNRSMNAVSPYSRHSEQPRKLNSAHSKQSTLTHVGSMPTLSPTSKTTNDFATDSGSLSHEVSNQQTGENTRTQRSVAAITKSSPLKARHLPAWTQTSFEKTHTSKPSRPTYSSNRIKELAKPRTRPRSCDFQRKVGDTEEKQRLPQPTITPYLMPVARWPRTMASMLLMGEVSPLYCAQTLNGSGQGRPRKRTARKGAATERVRSAMEARVQLSLAEKDFVKLAAQVLDQYDMLLIERQKLARTRPIKQVGDPY